MNKNKTAANIYMALRATAKSRRALNAGLSSTGIVFWLRKTSILYSFCSYE